LLFQFSTQFLPLFILILPHRLFLKMEHHWTPTPSASLQNHDDFLEFTKQNPLNNLSLSPQQPRVQQDIQSQSLDTQTLNEIKFGFTKMMQTLERLEQRLNRVEQTTSQILKNQQDVLHAPFISQGELDNARKVAEQLEHDTTVAKQLQAAFNKETEVKRSIAVYQSTMGQCPICGVQVNGMELESHVDKCLEQFSNDPKKATEVTETKKKVEQGFFSRLYKTSETKKVKTVSNVPPTSQSTPLLSDQHEPQMMINPSAYYPPAFSYPSYPQGSPQAPHQMMMPVYMYPPQHGGGSMYPQMGSNE